MALKVWAESPMFAMFFKPYELVKETTNMLDFHNASFIKTPQEIQMEMQQAQQMMSPGMDNPQEGGEGGGENPLTPPPQERLPEELQDLGD